MFDPKQHYEHSSLREIIVEHQFAGAALKALWCLGIVDVEILRSEFDGFGYDLVLTRGKVIRHIQSKSGLTLKKVGISRLLAEKPSGCVIFVQVDNTLNTGPFFWFGDSTGRALPSVEGLAPTKRTTPNASGAKPDRIRHNDVPTRLFTKFQTLGELLNELLGMKAQTTS